MKTFLRSMSAAALFLVPSLVAAQPYAYGSSALSTNPGVGNLVRLFSNVLDWAVPTLIACAVVYFLYGVLMYVIMGDDEEKKEKAKSTIFYGIVGIFVMVSVYGLVKLVQDTFGINNTNSLTAPKLNQIN